MVRAPSALGRVKVMSVLLSSALEMFWITMSMLTSPSASERKTLAASPTSSLMPRMVILASESSVATPESTASSMGISSNAPATRVPVSVL